ncbi:MAG TPA: serine hydrolase [Anaerolineales bacterium]|jgi:beta-lactamase class A
MDLAVSLKQNLDALLAAHADRTVAVAFHDLPTGAEYFARADESLHPASTFKVAVMMEIFHQARAGLLSLDDEIPVINSFRSIADGSPFATIAEDDADTALYEQIGGTRSLRELVRLMIVRSSNLATNLVIQIAGAGRVTDYLQALGIQGVEILRGPEDNKAFALGKNNSASARGLMQMMKSIAGGRAVSPSASEQMLQILLQQQFNEGIPARLPPDTRVAHKTGWNADHYHDFGIIYPVSRQPYILAVMTSGFEHEQEAHTCVADISASLYKSLTRPSG